LRRECTEDTANAATAVIAERTGVIPISSIKGRKPPRVKVAVPRLQMERVTQLEAIERSEVERAEVESLLRELTVEKSGLEASAAERAQDLLREATAEQDAAELAVVEVAYNELAAELEVKDKAYAQRVEAKRARRALAEMIQADCKATEELATDRSEVAIARVAAAADGAMFGPGVAFEQSYADAAAEWLEDVTDIVMTGSLFETLRSGEILCHLINCLKPGVIAKIERAGISYNERVNINHFIKACREMGVREYAIFCTDDLYENRNMALVVRCLHALGSAIQRTVPEFQGPHLGIRSSGLCREFCLDLDARGGFDNASFTPRTSARRHSFTPRSLVPWTPTSVTSSIPSTPRPFTTTASI